MDGELLPAAPLQPCAGAPSGRGHLFSGWANVFFQPQCPPCSTGMGHPLGMAPCAEVPHPVGFIRSVGFYPSLASTFPAHYCPLHGLVSLLHTITLTRCFGNSRLHCISLEIFLFTFVMCKLFFICMLAYMYNII